MTLAPAPLLLVPTHVGRPTASQPGHRTGMMRYCLTWEEACNAPTTCAATPGMPPLTLTATLPLPTSLPHERLVHRRPRPAARL